MTSKEVSWSLSILLIDFCFVIYFFNIVMLIALAIMPVYFCRLHTHAALCTSMKNISANIVKAENGNGRIFPIICLKVQGRNHP